MSENVLHFRMERHYDEEGVYYVINGVEIALTTDGESMEETFRNLREAVALYFQDDAIAVLPRLEVSFEVTEAYA